MITVVTPKLRDFYAAEIEQMHRQRHRIFKERMNWDVRSIGGLEIDEFDMLDAIYLIAGDAGVQGTWRILPTTGPYMLRNVFPQLLEGRDPPDSPAIWEMSRFSIEDRPQDDDSLAAVSRISGELFCGLVEYALTQGITEVWTAYDILVARLLKRIGCKPMWQSGRQRIGRTIAVAGAFEISERVLQELRRVNGFPNSVLAPAVPHLKQRAA